MQMPPAFTNCMTICLNKHEMRCLLFTIFAPPVGTAVSTERPRTAAHVIGKFADPLLSWI